MADASDAAATGRFRLVHSAWTIGAIGLTAVVVCAVALFGYTYADELTGPRVVCLMYHRFVTAKEFQSLHGDDRYYAIPIERFEEQLRWLHDQGYRSLSTDEVLSYLHGKTATPEKCVQITIDDGYLSTLTRAQPLLKKYGMKATLFVTAEEHAHVFEQGHPRQRRLTDEEIQSLDPTVIDVQAHGFTHRALSDLSDEDLLVELTATRVVLGRVTGRPVRCMAVPGNHYNDHVLRMAREAGYEGVFTSDPGSLDVGDDPFGLPRVNVAGYFDASGLASIIDPLGMARRRFIRLATDGPQRLLGSAIGAPISKAVNEFFAKHPPSSRHLLAAGAILIFAWSGPLFLRRRRRERLATVESGGAA